MCCYYILGGNVIFISYFNATLIIFLVFLELFRKIFLLMILWVIKNLSLILLLLLVFILLWWRSFYPFMGKIGLFFLSEPGFHKNGCFFSMHFRFLLSFWHYLWWCWLWYTRIVKACVHYFLSNFYFSQNDGPSKTKKKNFFISTKMLFSFSRYSNFCIFAFPYFFPCQPLLCRLIQEKP